MKTEVYVKRERQTDRERWEKGRERIGYHNCLMTSSLLLLMTSCSAIIKLYTFVTPGGLIIFSSCIKLLKKNIHACNIIFDEKNPHWIKQCIFFQRLLLHLTWNVLWQVWCWAVANLLHAVSILCIEPFLSQCQMTSVWHTGQNKLFCCSTLSGLQAVLRINNKYQNITL